MAQELVNTKRTHTMAIVSLVLGILGVVGVLPIIGSVGAIITGNMALNEITPESMYKGDDLAKAGRVLGWIGVGLIIFGLFIALMMMLFLIPMSVVFSSAAGLLIFA